MYSHDRALYLLRAGTNRPDAIFREGQAEAIRYIVEGRGRLLVVQKPDGVKVLFISLPLKCCVKLGMGRCS